MTYARSGHAAFFYRTLREYLDCLLPFISESVQAEQAVLKWLDGREIKKVIFVPDTLVNFVIIL